ncbi:Atrophin-1 multi-domain protein [Pyrenophora tritici-repentis]|uniref:Atrophin-1 multi-domain protein n=1 Tax=Pyrenophora tritici-repentis TaxID=45151 RepID=A0A834VQS3_9PLEO|nr:Atrophin-1 multi-domain protein [Pyrenophora tritici-repentis]
MVSFTGVALLSVVAVLFTKHAHAVTVPGADDRHNYKVAVSHFALTNTGVKDVYHPTEDRRVMASLFMPIAKNSCSKECTEPYMPSMTAAIANEQFIVGGKRDIGVFETMDYKVCCASSVTIDASKIPVVILEPNVDTSRLLYSTMARFISANGVAVVLIDHPGDSSIVQFTPSTTSRVCRAAASDVYNSGTVSLSNFTPLTSWNATIATALSVRETDIAFVMSQLGDSSFLPRQFPYFTFSAALNTTSYGAVGHGLGGTLATSLSVYNTSTTRFSINLSGAAPPLTTPVVNTPLFFFGRSPSFRRENALNWAATWQQLRGRISTEYDVVDADVFDMSDLPVIVELAQNEGAATKVHLSSAQGGPKSGRSVKQPTSLPILTIRQQG